MKFTKFISLSLFLLITSFYFGQSATVRGFVYEKENGEPIPFQKVKLVTVNKTIYGAVTDLNGFFSIPKLIIGVYTLKVESSGFDSISKKVDLVMPRLHC